MSDIECPYCEKELEINHNDGFGYEEDEFHKMQCKFCVKSFVFQTSISFDYEPYKADCLNGSDHKLKQIVGAPAAYFVGRYRCEDCGEEIIKDPEANKKAMEDYCKKLEEKNF